MRSNVLNEKDRKRHVFGREALEVQFGHVIFK